MISLQRRFREPDPVSDIHRAMANEHRRAVLYYLYDSVNVASTTDLVEHLSERYDTKPQFIAPELHHSILPLLQECGAITHDPDHDDIYYAGGSLLTELIETTMSRELR